MDKILFSIGNFEITISHIIGVLLIIAFGWFLHRFLIKWLIPRIVRNKEVKPSAIQNFKRQVSLLVLLFCSLMILAFLGFDQLLFDTPEYKFRISHLIKGLVIFQGARIIDWLVSNIYIHNYYINRDEKKPEAKFEVRSQEFKVNRLVQFIVSILAVIFLLNLFNADFSIFQRTIDDEVIKFRISSIFTSILIFLIAQLLVWIVIQLVLYTVYKRRKVDVGAQFAINQLFKYIVYVIAAVMVLDNLGLDITILLGGAAALLVGIGLGLQQTFNDFISGLVLLFERTVAVGDVLQLGPVVGMVKRIGLRASTIETRENITMLVPNSKLVNDNVTNWTHFDDKVRFDVNVGVAYGSDTELVKQILTDVANANPYIVNYPAPFVRFTNFGDSSLDFRILFFSKNYLVIEDIKSDMRFEIDKQFREKGITIPFPQRDVWMRTQG